MSNLAPSAPGVRRIQDNLLARSERRLLDWLCARMPGWVTPDQLTLLALVSSVVIFAGYVLSNFQPDWLWLAVVGYFTHWFGDSLDGSLARYRRAERPRYGYFIDHSCDGIAVLLIVGGIGLSPFVRLDVALVAVAAYLLLAVHTFLLAKVQGEFPLSHGWLGPTELRLILIAITLGMFTEGQPDIAVAGFTWFDLIVMTISAIMMTIFLIETWRKSRVLLARDNQRPQSR